MTGAGRDYAAIVSNVISNERAASNYSSFKISEIYKGALEDEIKIYYSKGGGSCAFGGHEQSAEYIIYASKDNNGYYSVDTCSPKTKIANLKEYINPHAIPELARLEKISEGVKAIDALIQENPKVLEFYFSKAGILKGIKDFQRLDLVYKEALKIAVVKDINVVHERYGETLYSLGKYKEALDPLQKANTDSAKVLYQKSLVYAGPKEEPAEQKKRD